MWEILGHAITTEEERGCEFIQAAANSPNAVALAYHEMELISSLSMWCSKSSAIAEQHTFGLAREAMMITYPDMVQYAEFVNAFSSW